ncbi:MAG: esterase-like activity of phytase family protein [Limisphaerales bacterium]
MRRLLPLLLLARTAAGCRAADAPASTNAWPVYLLAADANWLLEPPRKERFDASALLRLPDGTLLTVNDRGADLYRIAFRDGTNVADLVPWPAAFTAAQLAPFAREKRQRYDAEGLARDGSGRLYLCEETDRWLLRWDPRGDTVERLAVDWSPVKRWFHPADLNASFEGIAVGGGNLFVANERQTGRLLVLDLATLKVVDDFAVAPLGNTAKDTHYSDLCWAEDSLWVLLRDVRKILRVDPAARRVLAEFDYSTVERAPTWAYGAVYAPGFMEGMSVEPDAIWLVADNNGLGRRADLKDTRPTLFRCPRPDRMEPLSAGPGAAAPAPAAR